jgi:hypothetical protein
MFDKSMVAVTYYWLAFYRKCSCAECQEIGNYIQAELKKEHTREKAKDGDTQAPIGPSPY